MRITAEILKPYSERLMGFWIKDWKRNGFHWPENEADVIEIQGRELSWLLEGLSADQRTAHRQLSYASVI